MGVNIPDTKIKKYTESYSDYSGKLILEACLPCVKREGWSSQAAFEDGLT